MGEFKVKMEDLVGRHTLAGVDRVNVLNLDPQSWHDAEASNVLRLVLEGQTITFWEDPEDGYRSCLRDVTISNERVVNMFPECEVFVREVYDAHTHVLEFYDLVTGKVVVRVGTENLDDWYPYFVAEFDPTAMAVNAEPVQLKTISREEWLKMQAIRIAHHHREHCDGAECNISLSALHILLTRAGIELTDEEAREFM